MAIQYLVDLDQECLLLSGGVRVLVPQSITIMPLLLLLYFWNTRHVSTITPLFLSDTLRVFCRLFCLFFSNLSLRNILGTLVIIGVAAARVGGLSLRVKFIFLGDTMTDFSATRSYHA